MTEEGSEQKPESSLEERLESLLDSFVERFRNGEHPSITDYTRKHPELAKKIMEVFPASTFLGELHEAGAERPRPAASPGESIVPVSGKTTRLGEYRILREVGRGGMGVVYEAEQESLGRRVAVKVLPFHALMDERLLDRFRREAKAAASLRHPGIVPVFGMGEDSGIHFYAMQFVDGAGLDQVVRDVKRLSSEVGSPEARDTPAERESPSRVLALGLLNGQRRLSRSYFEGVARLVKDAAEALAYAHDQGVLHRDIKPSNLMLDSSGNVWVTDFGLAKAEGSEDLTRSGEVLGTLRYMAPETIHGISDKRSDVYSLGVTLHELLTLEPAFSGENRADLLQQVSNGTPRLPRRIHRQIPRPLETIVLKATCRGPVNRYPSSAELAADLGRFLEGRRVAARLPLLDQRLRRFVIARRGIAVTAVALLLLLVLVVARALIPAKPRKPQDLLLEDVNGDGKIDMLAANSGDRTDPSADSIAIVCNKGRGTFRRPVFIEVGDLPIGLVRADLDGDGSGEIVFANSKSMDISLLRRDGGGSFSRERLVELKDRPSSIAVADLDQDGDGDLAAAFNPSNDVLVFWNDGDKAFVEKTTVPVGPAPYFLCVADVNNDGKGDLVTTNGYDRDQTKANLSVVINRGHRVFEAATNYDVGDSTLGFTTGDFNGDGFVDIAMARQASPTISVFLNARDGTFPSRAAEYSLPSLIWTLSSADLDGDGDLDLAGAGGESSAFLLLGDGHGAFSDPVTLPAGSRPAYIKAADLDGDGDLDLAITNLDSDDITVLFNDGRGAFGRVESLALKSWFPW